MPALTTSGSDPLSNLHSQPRRSIPLDTDPIDSFSDDAIITDVNHVTNLVALCRNHHWELDNEIISL